MTKILLTLLVILFASQSMDAKVDVTKKPAALPAKSFKFPAHSTFELENGLKVFLIQDTEQPTISFSLLVPGGTACEFKPGVADMMASLMTKGAGSFSASEIAEKMDGLGADLSVSSSADFFNVYAGGLKKHTSSLLEMMTQVIMNPTFPNKEFDKLKQQTFAGIESAKADPGTLASGLTRKALYGANHPYAQNETKETVADLKRDDLSRLANMYFHPNNASLAVVGDITEKDAIVLVDKYFGAWRKRHYIPTVDIPKAKPMPKGVYFIARPASVQSSVMISTPTDISVNHKDYETLKMASSIIGAGFAGRLFRTVREKHSYTYSPFGYLTQSKETNRFACGADVRNSVTDSTIYVINEQLELLTKIPAEDAELNRVKNYRVGSYLMGFQSSSRLASLIQSADFYGVPFKELEQKHVTMANMTAQDIMKAANKYMNPKDEFIIVVGDPAVKSKLNKFGTVYEFDLDLKPIKK